MKKETLLEKYVSGMLTPAEKEEFNTLLKTDQEFKSEVQLIKDLKVISGAEDRMGLKQQLVDFESKINPETTPKNHENIKQKVIPLHAYKKWLIAASVALILGIGAFSLFNNAKIDNDQLYADHFEPYRNVVIPIARGENDDKPEIAAFIAYEQKKYEDAAQKFEVLYQKTKESYYLLYQANALLAINKTKKAISLLEKHNKLNDTFAEKSRWYLALANLKINNIDHAILLLKEIVEKDSYKSDVASKILEVIKE